MLCTSDTIVDYSSLMYISKGRVKTKFLQTSTVSFYLLCIVSKKYTRQRVGFADWKPRRLHCLDSGRTHQPTPFQLKTEIRRGEIRKKGKGGGWWGAAGVTRPQAARLTQRFAETRFAQKCKIAPN